jgi:hypothetical protein
LLSTRCISGEVLEPFYTALCYFFPLKTLLPNKTVNGCTEKYVHLNSGCLRHFAKPRMNISPSVILEFLRFSIIQRKKVTAFWNATSCRLLDELRRCGSTLCLHF